MCCVVLSADPEIIKELWSVSLRSSYPLLTIVLIREIVGHHIRENQPLFSAPWLGRCFAHKMNQILLMMVKSQRAGNTGLEKFLLETVILRIFHSFIHSTTPS